jgi:hypothetical protein
MKEAARMLYCKPKNLVLAIKEKIKTCNRRTSRSSGRRISKR